MIVHALSFLNALLLFCHNSLVRPIVFINSSHLFSPQDIFGRCDSGWCSYDVLHCLRQFHAASLMLSKIVLVVCPRSRHSIASDDGARAGQHHPVRRIDVPSTSFTPCMAARLTHPDAFVMLADVTKPDTEDSCSTTSSNNSSLFCGIVRQFSAHLQ